MRRSKRLSTSSSPLKLPPINEDTSLNEMLMDESMRGGGGSMGLIPSSSPNKTLGDESLERLAWEEHERQGPTIPLVCLSPNVEVRRGRRTPRKSGAARQTKSSASASDEFSSPLHEDDAQTDGKPKRSLPHKDDTQTERRPSKDDTQPERRPKRSLPSLLEFSPKRRCKTRDSGDMEPETPPTPPEERPSQLLKLMGKTPSPKRRRSSRSIHAVRGLHDVFSSSPLRSATVFSPEESMEDDKEKEGDEEATLRVGPSEPQVAESSESKRAHYRNSEKLTPPSTRDSTASNAATKIDEQPALLTTRTVEQRQAHKVSEGSGPAMAGTVAAKAAPPPSRLVSPAKRKRAEVSSVIKKASPFKAAAATGKMTVCPLKAAAAADSTAITPQPTKTTGSGHKATPSKASISAANVSPINISPVNPVKESILRKLQIKDKAVGKVTGVKLSPAKPTPSPAVRSPSTREALNFLAPTTDSAASARPARAIRQPSARSQPPRSTSATTSKTTRNRSASPEDGKRPITRSPVRMVSAPKAAAVSSAASGKPKASASPVRIARDDRHSPLRVEALRKAKVVGRHSPASPGRKSGVPPQGKVPDAKQHVSPESSASQARRHVSPARAGGAPEKPRRASASARTQRPDSPAKDRPCVDEPRRVSAPATVSPTSARVVSEATGPVDSSEPRPLTPAHGKPQTTTVARGSPEKSTAPDSAPAQPTPGPSASPPKVRVSKKTPSPHKIKSSAAPATKATRSRSAEVARDAKAVATRTKPAAKPKTTNSVESSSTRNSTANRPSGQVVPDGFRLTSTGSLAPVAPTLAKGESIPFAPSASHQAKLQKAIEEEERIRKERSQVKAHQVPAYLRERREQLEQEREEELQREIASIREGGKRKNALPDSLRGTRPRTRTTSTSTSKPFVSSLEARNQERQAWEAKRKAKEELLEHEREKVREEQRKREEEELRLERQRTVVKAHPVPEHIYGKRRVVSRGEQ